MNNNINFQETALDGSNRVRESHTQSDQEYNAELTKEMVRRTNKLGNAEVELALQVKQARDFLGWSVTHFRTAWMDWMEDADKALNNIRQLRVALNMESKTVVSLAKDVTDHFNAPEMVSALSRFREVTELLERIKSLKQDGTLDAFEGFILNIKCKG